MTHIQPFTIKPRYKKFNEYVKKRFSSFLDNKSNDNTDLCLCPTCQKYCNKFRKSNCLKNLDKCNWNSKSKKSKCETHITKLYCNCSKELGITEKFNMMKHQKFLYNYMQIHNKTNNPGNRGLLIYHGLGSGKTCTGILLSHACREYIVHKKTYKRKVILLIPASLNLDPWIKELSNNCNFNKDFQTKLKEYVDKNKNKSDKKQIFIYKNLCKKFDHYIIHYNADNLRGGWRSELNTIPTRNSDYFINKYSNNYNDNDLKRKNPFDDSIIIVDEAHNLGNNLSHEEKKVDSNNNSSKFNLLYKNIINSINSKIILLTGTPIVNEPSEISFLVNLLKGSFKKPIVLEDNNELFNQTFFKKKGNSYELKNVKMLEDKINGIISYNPGINKKVFADSIEKNIILQMVGRYKQIYENTYKLERKLTEGSDIDYEMSALSRQASNFVYPSWVYSLDEQKKRKVTKNGIPIKPIKIHPYKMKFANKFHTFNGIVSKKNRKDVLTLLDNDNKPLNIKNDLIKHSPKMYMIIKKILQSNGPVLVYSNFKGAYGIGILLLALEQNNIIKYDETENNSKQSKYILWTPETKKEKYKNIFNSYENKDGKIIKVFCTTASGKEGLNLAGIRQVHIIDPWWNIISDKQIIGRAIRICSHAHINKNTFKDFTNNIPKPYNNWLVNVFKYYSVIKNNGKIDSNKSIDIKIHNSSTLKKKKEKVIANLLQRKSIDYWLYNI